MLVSERATVFDRPMAPPAEVDPLQEISDPIWNHKGGRVWTPDLVHCRLLVTGEVLKRMPPVLRKGYVSQLGNLALAEMSAERTIAPSPAEIALADWTLWQIAARKYRLILLASSFGYSGDKIAEAMCARGEKTSGPTVQRYYLAERRYLAGRWQAAKVPIDSFSGERWARIFDRQK